MNVGTNSGRYVVIDLDASILCDFNIDCFCLANFLLKYDKIVLIKYLCYRLILIYSSINGLIFTHKMVGEHSTYVCI